MPDLNPATVLLTGAIPGRRVQPLISRDFTHYQLFADTQPFDQRLVSRGITAFQVLQKPTALAYHN